MNDPYQQLAELRGAPERWGEVAAIYARALRSPGGPGIGKISALTGYSANALRRMLATYRYAAMTEAADHLKLLERPFAHAELLAKIHALEPRSAEYYAARPDLTYRSLLNVHRDIRERKPSVAPVATGRNLAEGFRNQCDEAISRDGSVGGLVSGHNGKTAILRWAPPFEYANPDFLLQKPDPSQLGRSLVQAVFCSNFQAGVSRGAIRARFVQVAFATTFYDRGLLMMPAESWVHLDFLAKDAIVLDLTALAIATVDTNGDIRVRREDSGPPTPDRRGVLRKAFRDLPWPD